MWSVDSAIPERQPQEKGASALFNGTIADEREVLDACLGQPFGGVIYAHQLRMSIGNCVRDLEVVALSRIHV